MHMMTIGRCVALLAICAVAQCQLFDALYKYVIDKAADTSIPVRTIRQPVNVSIGMSLIQLTSLDPKSGDAELEVLMFFRWDDARLSWNPANFINTSVIRLPASKLWNPDVVLYDGHTSSSERLAVVDSTGHVKHMPPTTVKTRCDVSSYTTNGTVTCRLKYGSWVHDGFLIKLELLSNGVDVTDYNTGGTEWDLTGNKAQRYTKFYSCCPEPYPHVTFTLTFKKKGKRYSRWSMFS